jgi:hypothetical protein
VQRVKHPDTGQVYEAVAGSNYYYLPRGSDRPVGTDSTELPKHIDVTPLLTVQ